MSGPLELWLAIVGGACVTCTALIVGFAATDELIRWWRTKGRVEHQVHALRREVERAQHHKRSVLQ